MYIFFNSYYVDVNAENSLGNPLMAMTKVDKETMKVFIENGVYISFTHSYTIRIYYMCAHYTNIFKKILKHLLTHIINTYSQTYSHT